MVVTLQNIFVLCVQSKEAIQCLASSCCVQKRYVSRTDTVLFRHKGLRGGLTPNMADISATRPIGMDHRDQRVEGPNANY